MQTRRKEHLRKQKTSSSISTNPLIKYMTYDFFGKEWHGNCGACLKDFYAPTKSEYLMQQIKHTKSINCLGGY
jgi:GH18 family chitinase